jgi:hypothetical protein
VAAFGGYFFLVPLARFFERAPFGRDHIVNRPVILSRPEFVVLRRIVVEHLNLHPHVSRVSFDWRANADPVIRSLLELEFETQDEIAVIILRQQIPPASPGTVDNAVLDAVTVAVFPDQLPAVQRMAVEQSRETGLCVGGETRKRKTERELSGKKKFASVFVAHNSFKLIVVGADCRPLF